MLQVGNSVWIDWLKIGNVPEGTYLISPYLCMLLSYRFGLLLSLLLGWWWVRAEEVDSLCRIGPLSGYFAQYISLLAIPLPTLENRYLCGQTQSHISYSSLHLFVWISVHVSLLCWHALALMSFPFGAQRKQVLQAWWNTNGRNGRSELILSSGYLESISFCVKALSFPVDCFLLSTFGVGVSFQGIIHGQFAKGVCLLSSPPDKFNWMSE